MLKILSAWLYHIYHNLLSSPIPISTAPIIKVRVHESGLVVSLGFCSGSVEGLVLGWGSGLRAQRA